MSLSGARYAWAAKPFVRLAHGKEEPEQTTDLREFRILILLALATTICVTWPLWGVRTHPLMLPAIGLPSIALGAPMLFACIAALVRPVAGTAILTLLLVYGMAADQTRMQPEFFSLPILLWGTLPSPSARIIARVHLVTLWFYAGFNKLLSPEYLAEAGPRLVRGLPILDRTGLLAAIAVGIAVFEIGTALLAILPATRILAAWAALVVHVGALIVLAPLIDARNEAVWPWNLVLAGSGFAFIAPWAGSVSRSFGNVPGPAQTAVALLVLAPLGFYAGVVDAYPAHHLYSAGTARATVHCPAGCRAEQDINATWHALRVPMPPEPRLFYAAFARTCSPGDVLRIDDPHPPPWSEPGAGRIRFCPAGSLPASHP